MTPDYLQYFFGGVIALSIATLVALATWRPHPVPQLKIEDEMRERLRTYRIQSISGTLDNVDLQGRLVGLLYDWAIQYNSLDRILRYESAEETVDKVSVEIKKSSSDALLSSECELQHRSILGYVQHTLSTRENLVTRCRKTRIRWLTQCAASIIVLGVSIIVCVLSDDVLESMFHASDTGIIDDDLQLIIMLLLLVGSAILFLVSVFLRPGDPESEKQ